MIKKLKGKYYVFDHTGKKELSKGYTSEKAAKHRLKEIDYFANKKGVDLVR